METLQPTQETGHTRKQHLARELVAAAHRGEIHSIEDIDPRETSIEVVQQIRAILKTQGILPKLHDSNQL